MIKKTLTDRQKCLKRLFSLKKSSSKKRRLAFQIDLKTFAKLSEGECEYCGAKESNTLNHNGMIFGYNGIDRLDSKRGYYLDNVVSCCAFCNTLKGSMPMKTWAAFLKDVANKNFAASRPDLVGNSKDLQRKSKRFWKGRKKR